MQEDVYFHGEPEEIRAYSQDRLKNLFADRKAEAVSTLVMVSLNNHEGSQCRLIGRLRR